MKKFKHTPGPWHGRREAVTGPDGTLLAAIQFVEFNGGPIPMEEGHANARLISAAPELLAIAKLIIKEWAAPTEGVLPGELIARLSQYAAEAKAAIEKAEGA